MNRPHSDPQRAGDPFYDSADFRQDQIRGKSDYPDHALDENPYPFGEPPGDAPWHAWREGWFLAHGRFLWEEAERKAER